jgi:tRNA threonylcarbamoyladenosine biosynthesis protein TsaB
MRVLAADTTTSVNTVAVCDGPRLLAETVVDCGRTHTERLVGTVDWVLGQAGLALGDLDALAISTGPGSFTGLRVGVSAWKGLAMGTGLPLVPVATLDAMTNLRGFRNALVCPLLDAKMGEVFGAVYQFDESQRTRLTDARACPVEELVSALDGTVLFLGDGAVLYRDSITERVADAVFLPPSCGVPRASAVAQEALAMLEAGLPYPAEAVAPVYLRSSQAERARDKAQAP